MPDRFCDVCGVLIDCGKEIICCSPLLPITNCYCPTCHAKGIEPYSQVVQYCAGAGEYPKDVNSQTIKFVKQQLTFCPEITEEMFAEDVDKLNQESYAIMKELAQKTAHSIKWEDFFK